MQLTVYSCDGCGKKCEGYPGSNGWLTIDEPKKGSFCTNHYHVCSNKCLKTLAERLVQTDS